eukprot:TRINITY_DN31743_c0_g1_i1.p1 TRINITY_DN31743_c0_g1~~TRINITY_DN31743_c0_g1_i1.p1  ORF type:complete len:808 (-),score=154.43 TRINITY_DN31743_c0_g1_i1:114-2492(-)
MVGASRLVSGAVAAVLLSDARSLLTATRRRDRRFVWAQIQLTVLLALLRSDSGRELVSKVGSFLPQSWRRAAERITSTPLGALAGGLIVPALLGATGLPLWSRPHSKGRTAALAAMEQRFRTVVLCGSVPTFLDAVEARFGEDTDAVAVLGMQLGLLLGEQSAAAVILLMLTGGEALEAYAFTRARQGLEHVLDEAPPIAHRLVPSEGSPVAKWRKAFTDPNNTLVTPLALKENEVSGGSHNVTIEIEEVLEEGADASEINIEDLEASEVQCGDVLAVRAGEVVPVDGVICQTPGAVTLVDESLVTGEGCVSPKKVKDLVLSGSVAHKPLWMIATSPFASSTFALMRKALQDAMDRKGQLQERSEYAATVLRPLTFAVAALALAARRRGLDSARQRWTVVLSVLMAATPCPATIGVPVAVLSGMSVAARHGVLLKSGAAVEGLAAVTHVVLDKTGTLTTGVPSVRSFEVFECSEGSSEWEQAFRIVASAELMSTHPLAGALRNFATARGIPLVQADGAGVEIIQGRGVVGSVCGRKVIVGTAELLKSHGIDVTQDRGNGRCHGPCGLDGASDLTANAPPSNCCGVQDTAFLEIYFALDGRWAGRATFEDTIREGVFEAVAHLQDLGLKLCILSGDRGAEVPLVARKLGIEDVRGGCLPHEKASFIEDITSKGGIVAMIGDESNDAPALAAAHVGISVGVPGSLASWSADVVVNAKNSVSALERVASLVVLCRATVKTARRGVRGGLSLSAMQVLAAGFGFLPPRANAIVQELVDSTALANAVSVLAHGRFKA